MLYHTVTNVLYFSIYACIYSLFVSYPDPEFHASSFRNLILLRGEIKHGQMKAQRIIKSYYIHITYFNLAWK
jgi:hypothetical protein